MTSRSRRFRQSELISQRRQFTRPLRVEALEPRLVLAGEPILVVTTASNPFSSYYAEILRAEGLNAFVTSDIAAVSPATLADREVVILGEMPLSASQVTMFSQWVTAGGNLIAMRPDKQLSGLLGLSDASATLANAYLQVDTASGPGVGIVDETIQFHGTADRYTLAGATSVATLYASATATTNNPAVTLRSVGTSGGQAAAFTYDLARSVVYTRQGNPAWSGQNRDGLGPIRSNDLFYGNASFDPQPDWIDLNKIAIPQADEQQRLLANLIQEVNLDNFPLPRFWYLPRGEKAAVVMTGDDHGLNGTAGRFDQYVAASPPGAAVANWEAIRGTSYVYPTTPLSDAQAAAYVAQGFEIGLHVTTNASDWTPAQLDALYASQLAEFQAKYPSLPPPVTNRTHAIVWSDYVSQAKVEAKYGIRFDTNYYHFGPPNWIQGLPGLFTGSAMPMRFADMDGTLIDVYQAATQMTDESGQNYPATVNALLDAALDSRGYYGVFTANMHTDNVSSPGSDAIIASAKARGVPIVSSRQMLDWLDGRNGSSFSSLAWDSSLDRLSFVIAQGAGASGLDGMLPVRSADGVLTQLTRNGSPVAFTTQVVKGVEYAFFPGTAGTYSATFAPDQTPPALASRTPAPGATSVLAGASIAATFSEPVQPGTISIVVTDSGSGAVPGSSVYDAASNTVTFTPSSPLARSATYTVVVSGAQDEAGNTMTADTWSFTTAAAITNATIWPGSAVPSVASANDSGANELGVKFRSDIDGFITGVRFYKGAGNTGTHVGHLWTASGTLLATATFATETATGWQQVNFAQPVPIQANTTYVASYFAPSGHYSFDGAYFASAGVDAGVLHALPSGAAGGNGVFFAGSSGFPTSSFNATNYWVDVVFNESVAPAIAAKAPAANALEVALDSAITVTFNGPMNAATINSTTFRLRAEGAVSDVPATISYSGLTATLVPSAILARNKTYHVTVSGSIASAGGTPLGSDTTWSFTTQGNLSLTDTTAADFAAGTPGAGIALTQAGDGEVSLAPTAGSEFSGTALPAGWTSTLWNAGGTATVGGGRLTVDGVLAGTATQYTPGRSLEFVATFSGDAFQHAGLATDFNSALWAMFSTGAGGALFARTASPSGSSDTQLAAGLLGGAHHFRIDWTATGVTYFVDGVQVAAHNIAVTNSLRPVASDFSVGGGNVSVDWLRLSPYAASGTFDSRVIDAGAAASWLSAAWTADVPAGTSLTLSVRAGNTPTPDGTWTSFAPLAGSGAAIGQVARYLQYRAELATTSGQTPVLQSVTFQYAQNTAPEAASDSFTTAEDSPLAIAAPGILANDLDPDGNALTAVLVAGPAHGTLTLAANGSFVYTPAANYNGPDSFTYRANDGSLDSNVATVSLTVTPVNDAPVATGDTGITAEDTPFTVPVPGVLGNDTDVDSGSLTAVLVSGPLHGSLTLNANGSFTYTPAANYNGPDSFTYRASDGSLNSNVATVSLTVTPVNDTPVAAGDSGIIAEDTPLVVSAPGVLVNDTDVDGDSLTAVLVSGPAHGTLTLNANGSYTYTPTANYHGPDSFTYRASDGSLDSSVATVSLTVTPVNDAPVAAGNSYSTLEEMALVVAAPGVLANDTDIDGDALTAVLVSGPAHGSLTLNANGSFNYTPAAAYFGPDSFTYQARDTSGALSSAVTVEITVTPPTISINNVSGNEGALLTTPFTFTVSLSSPTSRTITVNYATANGTATNSLLGDYQSTSGTVTFTGGQTSRPVTVLVNGDVVRESNETFFVNLSGATTPIADAQGQGTIVNDDFLLLQAAGGEQVGTSEPALTSDALDPIVSEAAIRWTAAGADQSQLAALSSFEFRIADLPGATLGATTDGVIWIDVNAAGYGWFVDPTPAGDSEFLLPGDQGEQGRIDLLTAVIHELGHALGLQHTDEQGVMHDVLEPGARHAPGWSASAAAVAWLTSGEFGEAPPNGGPSPDGDVTKNAERLMPAAAWSRLWTGTAARTAEEGELGSGKLPASQAEDALDEYFAALAEDSDDWDF